METNNEETTEPTIEDPKAVLSALERAKADAKKFREEKEELEARFAEKDEALSKYTGNLIQQKVADMLKEQGISNSSRVLKFVDMSQISLDEDFNVVGFETQMEQLKEDLPEIFDPKLRVGGQADAAVRASVSTQYSATEMQAMKILGKSK